MMRCPRLRFKYLNNLGDPFTLQECRVAAFKMGELHKLGEAVPFETLCSCVLFGDVGVRDFLLRFTDVGSALISGLENVHLRTVCTECLSMYTMDHLEKA